MPAKIALTVSIALMVVVVALTLTRSSPRVVRAGVRSETTLATATGSAAVCQAGEILPAGVSAIRLGMEVAFGPKVLVRAYSGSRLLTSGSRPAGWTGSSVTVPVEPLEHTASHVKLCFSVPANSGYLQIYGAHIASGETAVGDKGQALPGRMSIEYLKSGGGSWWSRILSVARHMGIGHAVGGTWLALLVAALVATASALVVGLAWRELP